MKNKNKRQKERKIERKKV